MSDEVDDKPGDIKPPGPQNAEVVKPWNAIGAVAAIVAAVEGIIQVIPIIDNWVKNRGVPSWLDDVLVVMVCLTAAVAVFAGLRFAIRRNLGALAWQLITGFFIRINRRLKNLANVATILYRRTYLRLVGLLPRALSPRKKFVIVVVALAAAGVAFAVLQKPGDETDNRPNLPKTPPSAGTPTPSNSSLPTNEGRKSDQGDSGRTLTPQPDRLPTGPETTPDPLTGTPAPDAPPTGPEAKPQPNPGGGTPAPDATPSGPETKPQPNPGGSTPVPSNGRPSIRPGVQGQGHAGGGTSGHRPRPARPGCGDPALTAAQQFSGGVPCGHMRKGADGAVYYNPPHQ